MPFSRLPQTLLWSASLALAMRAHAAPPAGTLGLVALPEVFGTQVCQPYKADDIPLYAAPDDRAKGHVPIGRISVVKPMVLDAPGSCSGLEVQLLWADGKASEEWPTEEYANEEKGGIVLARQGDMLKIATDRAPAWIHRPGLRGFMPASTLLKEQLLELLADLRPLARRAPGGASAQLAWQPKAASFLQAREVKGRLWLQLEVHPQETCSFDITEASERARVWVPFHDAKRRPTVWFYSRGC